MISQKWRFFDLEKYSINIPFVYLASEDEIARMEGLTIFLKDRPGLLGDMLNKLRDLGLNIVQIFHSTKLKEHMYLYILFETPREFRGREVVDEVIRRLKAFEEVINVELAEKRGRMIFFKNITGFTYLGEPAIIIGKANMMGLTVELSRTLGVDVAKLVINNVARTIGKTVAKLYSPKVGLTNLEDALYLVKYLLRGSSWVEEAEFDIFSPNLFTITLKNPWECMVAAGHREYWDKPYFVAYIVQGFFDEVVEKASYSWDVTWRGQSCTIRITVSRGGYT